MSEDNNDSEIDKFSAIRDYKYDSSKVNGEEPTEEQKQWYNEKISKGVDFPPVSDVEIVTTQIMLDHSFVTIEETKKIWYWEKGVYKPRGEVVIEKEAEKYLGFKLKISQLEEILGHIRRRTYRKISEFDVDLNIINLKSGLYDIEENTLKEHAPGYLSIKQIPVLYDPNARPKQFYNFLSDILYPSDVRTIIQLFAYTFHRDNPFEIIVTLLGYGSNGKSVLLGILTALHGENNVSNVSMKSIVENHFALADLEGKNVNIDTELSGATINDTAVLKKLTGRQRFRVERKRKDAYETKLYCKFFFNANKPLETHDDSDAWIRRNITVELPNQFDEAKDDDDLSTRIADPYILNKLTTEAELSGIFNLLMGVLRFILRKGKIYVKEKSIQKRREKYELSRDPTTEFLKSAIADDSTVEDWVTKETLYQAYKWFCKSKSLMILSKGKFGSNIKNIYHISEDRLGSGKRETIWKGIKLTQEYLMNIGQTTLIPLKYKI